ncbi:hypothetical protein CkaCkLH20_06147 [Colletotrichum karsti]|uniref:Uncharacterized protein n=1 Tax=Colletotrichum karsti TaxID=1095194 RepID=A0A9P6I556_9PEZI|nr:uncharacterized protein CkaCkLH20_06147 [Colletotrichum karsti]KAF9876204.1 hypothetical protein CkaCkLH20_06147 [Colletotrichum karsti]
MASITLYLAEPCFSAAKLQELRYEAKTLYYHQHICDATINDVHYEDFIDDYIEAAYQAQSKPVTPASASIASTNKTASKLRRFLNRITRKKILDNN